MAHPSLNRRQFNRNASALALGAMALPVGCSRPKTGKPNILFIVADDLGYADLSCYGRRDYETPHCDRLASSGIKFTQAYANSPVCSATRTALMTGQYQYRLPVGLEEPLSGRPVGLPTDHPTLPSILKENGYNTALVGKWHLGALPEFGPLKSGYDHFFGFRGGGIDYFTHRGLVGNLDLWDGSHTVEETGYLTHLLGDRAIDLIDNFAGVDSEAPFFMSLHFSAPHWPWQDVGDEAEAQRLSSIDDIQALVHFDGGSMGIYAGMVREMDKQIGRILDRLEQLDIADNTIVVFTSDNGGERFSDTWPFTGVKTELLEGGIRVPAIMSWPGTIQEGLVSEQVTASMDWMPTLLAAAGAQPAISHPSDGIDLLPLIGQEAVSRRLFWRYQHMLQEACRDGDLKYLKIDGNEFLFDLSNDPRERANLKDRLPESFAALKQQYSEWEDTMLPRDPKATTHGFGASDMADHFGASQFPE